MVDNLDVQIIAVRLKPFFAEVIDQKGGGPKAVTRRLNDLGHDVKERTVASWREGRYVPSVAVAGLLSVVYGVSLDLYLRGEALERTVVGRLEEVEQQVARLAGRLHAWEIELASAEGREPPGDDEDGALNLESARFRRRVEELERLVGELRQQQA